MSSEHRSIIMRSNRLLGAALVEHNLITVEQLEEANEHFFQLMEEGSIRRMCLLDILLNTTHALDEARLLEHTVEDLNMALLDLREIDIHDDFKISLDTRACWATWTVPFDKDEDICYAASAYHLSPAVKQFWEKQLNATIVWYGTTLDSISDFLEKFEAERAGTDVGFSPTAAEEGAA